MKKSFAFLLTYFTFYISYSQNVGIGTATPAASAQLDVSSTTKGLLVPRMSSAQRTAIASPARGLLVFDTTTNSFWFRNTGSWVTLSSSGWSLTGNVGTIPATNFIGTRDDQPLLFRIKNQPSGIIDSALANTALGFKSLFSNITGIQNTANGVFALFSNYNGYNNTANGMSTLYSNTTGYDNTANGAYALVSNTIGHDNTANGAAALYRNTTGDFNTASGKDALYQNTTGGYNTANGVSALQANTTGTDNTASGYAALYSNSTGSHNTAIGGQTLNLTTASEYNTAVGWGAGSYGYDNGWNNVFLGANTRVNGNGYYNVIAIGQDVTCTESSQVRVGNTATSSIGGQVGWTTLSDVRMKTNVQENVKGLEFIKLLHPVTYNLDAGKIDAWLKKNLPEKNKNISTRVNQVMQKARNEKSKIRYSGFLAQDVEKAARQIGYDFSGVDAPKNDNGLYGLRYAEFVVPLVKAVQELNVKFEKTEEENEELKRENESIKQQNENIKQQIEELKQLILSKK
jgi:hypothetical protein